MMLLQEGFNWTEFAASVITTGVIQAAAVAFVYGKLTQKVSDHYRRLGELEKDQDRQWEKINSHGERIAAVAAAKGHD